MGDGEPICIDDEIPYELPSGWCWARLVSLCSYLHRGKSPKYSEVMRYPVFAQKCNQPTHITLDKVRFADPGSFGRYNEEHFLRTGDIVINSTGTGTLGRVGMFDEVLLGDWSCIVADSHVTVARLLICASGYIQSFLKSEHGQNLIFSKQTGSTNQKELPTMEVEQFLIPVPPLNEQKQIARTVDSFFNKSHLE